MIYRVDIGFYSFNISDDNTAIKFAELAKQTLIAGIDGHKPEIYIKVLDDEEVAEDE